MLRQPHESARRRLRAGRIRSDALFESTFGATSAAVQQGLVAVDFVGQTPSLNTYLTGTLGGTFEWRPIANTNRLSAHSYGIAIDIVVSKSNYWEWEKNGSGAFVWKNEIPQAIVDASRPRASRGAAAGTTTLGQRALNVRGSLGLRTQRLVTFTPREESGLGARGL